MKEFPIKLGVFILLFILYKLTSIEHVICLIGAWLIVDPYIKEKK